MNVLYDAFERAHDAETHDAGAQKLALRELFGFYCDALHALEGAAARIHAIDSRYAEGVRSRADDIARYGARHLLLIAGLPVHEESHDAEP